MCWRVETRDRRLGLKIDDAHSLVGVDDGSVDLQQLNFGLKVYQLHESSDMSAFASRRCCYWQGTLQTLNGGTTARPSRQLTMLPLASAELLPFVSSVTVISSPAISTARSPVGGGHRTRIAHRLNSRLYP